MASFSIENEHLSYVNRKQILQKNVPNTQLYMDSNKMANRYKNHRLGDKELLILCTVLHHVICQRLAREFFPLHKPTFLDPPATWHRWHNPTICLMNCVYKELICFCLVTRWKFDYNSLRRIKSVSWNHHSCFLSKNQVKQVQCSTTADPSGYTQQNHCFGHVFTDMLRDKDKRNTQLAFRGIFLRTS